jgi:hypothetical protein
LETYTTFANELNEAANAIRGQESKHDHVRVLSTYWDTDSSDWKQIEGNTIDLGTAFRGQYGFQTERLVLAQENGRPLGQLAKKFVETTDDLNSKTEKAICPSYITKVMDTTEMRTFVSLGGKHLTPMLL